MPCFGIVFQCASDHVTHSAPSRETSVSTLTQPHKTAYTPPPPPSFDSVDQCLLLQMPVSSFITSLKSVLLLLPCCACVCVCVCVSVSVSGCSIAYSDLWSDLHFFSPGGGMDTKIRVSTESWPWRRKFTSRSCRDLNPQPFDHESCTLTTELSPPPIIFHPTSFPIHVFWLSGLFECSSDLVHDADECTAHHALAHVLDLVDDVLSRVDCLQQEADVCTGVDLLLHETK